MIALSDKTPMSFDDFADWYPEDAEHRYELRRGVVIEMPKPRGQHSRIAGDLAYELGSTIRQTQRPWFIPKECIIKITNDTGYEPDVTVLDDSELLHEPRWERESILTRGQSVKLAIEVMSTNWRDDYLAKLGDYEALGIQEYWIVDYLGMGGRRYIGSPKQPTLTVCTLVDGEYELSQFRGSDRILSITFPTLQLTAAQVFNMPG
ncbi:Uma2 family endonuclease [Halomicronema sp. CCY15110]|uniref:Uma2 family endonuclease n=1 Tax=Halomicronema sp. CCY15110 TaxID=2767773 RepID=UPI00194DFEEF|nr:Uma2 family endonuclease [Halomicronema sp. CCY15110]